jgi:hypothetical protein
MADEASSSLTPKLIALLQKAEARYEVHFRTGFHLDKMPSSFQFCSNLEVIILEITDLVVPISQQI